MSDRPTKSNQFIFLYYSYFLIRAYFRLEGRGATDSLLSPTGKVKMGTFFIYFFFSSLFSPLDHSEFVWRTAALCLILVELVQGSRHFIIKEGRRKKRKKKKMGNASSVHDGEAPAFNPETIVQDAVRICQKSFFYGVGKNFPFSIDLGVALGGEAMHQKDGSIALLGFYRQKSWARHSPMYPIEFVFSRKNNSAFAVQVRGTVKYVGAGGGWAHVGEEENFDFYYYYFFFSSS
jgi:hypothetical protein